MDTSAQEVDVALLQVQREHFSFAHFSFIASKTAKESTREKKDNYLADKFFHAVLHDFVPEFETGQLRNGSMEKLYFSTFCRAIQALQNST